MKREHLLILKYKNIDIKVWFFILLIKLVYLLYDNDSSLTKLDFCICHYDKNKNDRDQQSIQL